MHYYETPEFETVSAKDLLTRLCEPTEFTIDEILPHGLYLLSGKAKLGKTLLSFGMSCSVANGNTFWHYPAAQGDVLYLALEDSAKRVHERTNKVMTDCDIDAPTDVHFVTQACRIGCGLEDQINNFLSKYPNTRLIVIDSLQQVRSFGKGSGTYAGDYYDMDSLREVIRDKKLSMIVITHNHKTNDADPLDRVHGSVGLTGDADGIFVLEKRKRTGDRARLTITNRYAESHQFDLKFDRETCRWDFIGEIRDEDDDEDEQIFALIELLLDENSEWRGTATELCNAFNTLDKTQTLSPITLARTLSGKQEYLHTKYQIVYKFFRTKSTRLIELSRENGNDDFDESVSDELRFTMPEEM